MTAPWSGSAASLLAAPAEQLAATLAAAQFGQFHQDSAAQLTAWQHSIATLQAALRAVGSSAAAWHVLLEYPMLRLGMRIDAVLLTPAAILVLEFKRNAAELADRRQAEDYALNLRDFHDASRHHPIVPILISDGATPDHRAAELFWHAVTPVQQTTPAGLAALLTWLHATLPTPARPLDPHAWTNGAYRPVPTIVEAAIMTYARNGVAEIATARADQKNLRETTEAIRTALAQAESAGEKLAIFVTGIPGAGKTLCGLNVAFSEHAGRATFLTGNPSLVHVLRAALLKDATAQGRNPRTTSHQLQSNIQALPHFRNDHLLRPDLVPPERIALIDEAQRCWSAGYAIRKTADKTVKLTASEPAHLLDIMSRHQGFAAVICLVGSGQEIHDGEGGLAEWGAALAARPAWRVHAPPDILPGGATNPDPRWQLHPTLPATRAPLLHLDTAIRQIRGKLANAWVSALLDANQPQAAALAQQAAATDGLPFFLTRELAAARAAVRALARGNRRCGILASAGAARLRAEGLGAELAHQDAGAVANWFLNRFPADIRASDALEQISTEFSCQGLELDVTLLAWDADLIRDPGPTTPWRPRRFRGTDWQAIHRPEAAANQLNTYRVLLTRARYETVVFVPGGDATDRTRNPAVYDAIATYLAACGVRPLSDLPLPDLPLSDLSRAPATCRAQPQMARLL